MQVDVQRSYPAAASALFKLCSTPAFFRRAGASLSSGFMDFREGGHFRYEFAEGGNVWGEFTKIVPEHEIVMIWSTDHANGSCKDTVVTITFEPHGDETILSIKHAGFADQEAMKSHEGGWVEIFETLGSDFNGWLGAAYRSGIKLAFQFSQRYEQPASTVFRALQGEDSITQFFVHETTGPLETGAVVQWRFRSHPGRAFHVLVKDVVEDQKIQFQWGHTRVHFSFDDIPEGGSRFTISCEGWDATQEGLDDSYSECEGWREVMGSLQQWLTP